REPHEAISIKGRHKAVPFHYTFYTPGFAGFTLDPYFSMCCWSAMPYGTGKCAKNGHTNPYQRQT
ncbi:hypothetical protein, partial [Methylobacillus methanolivorans]